MEAPKIDYSKIVKELRIMFTPLPERRFWGILVAAILIMLITKLSPLDLTAKDQPSIPVSSHTALPLPTHTPQTTP